MLTPDLIRPHIRNGCIGIPQLTTAKRERLLAFAQDLLCLTCRKIGATREEWLQAVSDMMPSNSDGLACKALQKLVEDACDFAGPQGLVAMDLRHLVFATAATARKEAQHTHGFHREEVLQSAGEQLGLAPKDVEKNLFSDLRSEQRLISCRYSEDDVEGLLEAWRFGQVQAILLRAVSVTATISDQNPKRYRDVFRRLKFHQLLFAIEEHESGFRVHMDGPASLFSSSTKYGLKLALALSMLAACEVCDLQAEISWGKKRRKNLSFSWSAAAAGGNRINSDHSENQDADIEELARGFSKLTDAWELNAAPDILHIPGAGVCVPDLAFISKETGRLIYFEKMGFWSRDAVWKRVEMVEAGLQEPVLFAVSERLRVSDRALGKKRPSALYVYKGKMSASKVLQKLEELHDR